MQEAEEKKPITSTILKSGNEIITTIDEEELVTELTTVIRNFISKKVRALTKLLKDD